MQTCKLEQVDNDSRTASSKGAVQKPKERDDQKNVESDLNGDFEIQAAQTVLKRPRLKNILATANKERVEVYHDPKEQNKRPTVSTLDA